MYDLLWAIPTILSVSLFGACLFMALQEVLQHKNILKFFMWLFAFVMFFLVSAYCINMMDKGSRIATSMCRQYGYQSTQYDNDGYYCIKFGNEPEIIKLEGVK